MSAILPDVKIGHVTYSPWGQLCRLDTADEIAAWLAERGIKGSRGSGGERDPLAQVILRSPHSFGLPVTAVAVDPLHGIYAWLDDGSDLPARHHNRRSDHYPSTPAVREFHERFHRGDYPQLEL